MMFAGKKNISLYLSVLSILQIAMSFVLSCDNSGTDPDTGNRITITVVDQHGTPLQDVSIMTVPATEQFTTNRNGSAIIPIESWGAYKILATRPNGDTLEKHVLVRVADVSVQLKFTYAPLSITVSDAKGRPMQGAEVLLSPSPLKILTNDQGIAKTDSVLVRGYELSIAHDSEIVYSSEITLSETIPNVYKITASQASLTLIVTDKDGVPYDDITAITEPSGFIARSDSNGVIIFDGIPALEYTILLNRYNTLCIRIRKDLTEGTPPPVSVILSSTDIDISFINQFGKPYENAKVSLHPSSISRYTDAEGRVSFPNMPIAFYTISVTWNDKKLYSAGHMVNTKDTMSIPIVYHAKAPKATFVEPKGPTIPHMNIKFIGEGNDTEDGALPDSMLVWRSSVDGELGRGSTITVDGLSSGSHTISLEVTDSDGKTDIVEKRFTVLTYDSASYFPIANYAGWTYVNKPKVIIMTTEEGDEEWELGDIHVEIGEENTRISSMEYRRTIGGKKKQYSYVVTDWLKYDGQKVLVWKTHELLSVKTQYSPLQVLNVTSVYTPHYPLISDVFNVRTMPVIDQTFNVNTTWKLRSGFVREFTESFSSHVHVEPEGTEKLITPFGTTETVIIRIEQHNSLRRWWLSPGTGIVKMTHNMFNPMVEAVLFATNLDSFRETERGMRPIAGKASTTLVSPPVHDKIPDDLYRSLTIGRMFHPFRQPAFPDENSFELQD